MVLKRKRSESELSLSSSSAFNSPQRPDHFSSMDLDTSPIRRTSRSSTPSHLPSRTMKRFRDSRPSDEEIHQRTLNMLYTAQKQHLIHQQQQQELAHMAGLAIHPQPQPQPQPRLQITSPHSHGAAQASLHSFWKLPSAAAPPTVAFPPPVDTLALVYDSPANCEDCGQMLAGNEDAMDVDDFGAGAEETSCGACGKHVCSHCSITNLGEQRRCLICAGKKVWVGGLGWAGVSGVKVC